VTLDALVRHADGRGYAQRVVVGVPVADEPAVGGLPADAIAPLRFETDELPFPVPGMSDVMPYPSTRFSELDAARLARYRAAWRSHLERVVTDFAPDLIHAHHLWIVGSLLKDVAPDVPVLSHCHATGLRQARLCPELADDVRAGCVRNDAFLALHADDAAAIRRWFGVAADRVHVIGAGYRDELFHPRGRRPADPPRLVYVGKYSAAKGLPWLLAAVERLRDRGVALELHVAGSGSGAEADALAGRMRSLAPTVVLHGALGQAALAELLRTCAVCVLPSLWEGLPLVLVEALACGCRLVATDLPGVRNELAPSCGEAIVRVPRPPVLGVDRLADDAAPRFVDSLVAALDQSIERFRAAPLPPEAAGLERFTWSATFRRVETIWSKLLGV
jgi:glycosyltransferase involved in cell wall biosynthesis